MSVSALRTALRHALVEGKVQNYVTDAEMKEVLAKADKAFFGFSDRFTSADAAELVRLHENARQTFRGDDFVSSARLDRPTLSYAASLRLWKALAAERVELKNKPTVDEQL